MVEATNVACTTEHSTIGLLSLKYILYTFLSANYCNHNNEYNHIMLSDGSPQSVCWYFWVINITLYRDGRVDYDLIYCIKNNTRMDQHMPINRIVVTPNTSRNLFMLGQLPKLLIIQSHWSHRQQLAMDGGYRDLLADGRFSGSFSAGHPAKKLRHSENENYYTFNIIK